MLILESELKSITPKLIFEEMLISNLARGFDILYSKVYLFAY